MRYVMLACAVVVVSACQVIGGGTRVRFLNATSGQTLTQLSFGFAAYAGPLGPGQSTGYFPIEMGSNLFSAVQDGTATATMQFSIGSEASYTLTLSDLYETTIGLTGFANGDTVTVNAVVFTAGSPTTPSLKQFSVTGPEPVLAALATCVADPTFGVPGVTAGGTYFSSTAAPVAASATTAGGTFTTSSSYTMTVALIAD